MKKKIMSAGNFILARSKIVFPILLIAAVAVTVTISLQAGSNGANAAEETQPISTSMSESDTIEVPVVAFEVNAYPAVNELIRTYYTARAEGDSEAIIAIQDRVENIEQIKIEEFGKYIESYPLLEVYTKPGPVDDSYLVIVYSKVILSYYPEDEIPGYETLYVCTDGAGSLYINTTETDEMVTEYIRTMLFQDDIVELLNKITVEYNDVCFEKPELLQYMSLIEQQATTAAGVILAQQLSDISGGNDTAGNAGETGGDDPGNGNVTQEPEVPIQTGPIYATTTATVNVRSSDSETADRLGRVSSGSRIEVLEQKPNGWSKVVYEGKEGYIKSEFLELIEDVSNVEIIGTVTATTNVNVRSAPSETASKLGVAVGGSELQLVGYEGDWCKVIYNSQIGYVKSDFVQ